MGKLKLLLICLMFIGCYSVDAAVVKIEINNDTKSLGELSKNIATQEIHYELQKEQLRNVEKKQDSLKNVIGIILGHKELIFQTYKSVTGFKKESKYYINICKYAYRIAEKSGKAFILIKNAKFIQKTNALLRLTNLMDDATDLGRCFVDIVTNKKVVNPFDSKSSSKGDGLNLLNRYERLKIAGDILVRLRDIEATLDVMMYLAEHSNGWDLLNKTDVRSYHNYLQANYTINSVLQQWQKLTH